MLTSAWDGIKTAWDASWGWVKDKANIWDWIKTKWNAAWGWIKGILTAIWAWIKAAFHFVFDPLKWLR